MSAREQYDFAWGMTYGAGIAVTIFIAVTICGFMGVFS